jgi:hypothetical protein
MDVDTEQLLPEPPASISQANESDAVAPPEPTDIHTPAEGISRINAAVFRASGGYRFSRQRLLRTNSISTTQATWITTGEEPCTTRSSAVLSTTVPAASSIGVQGQRRQLAGRQQELQTDYASERTGQTVLGAHRLRFAASSAIFIKGGGDR